MTAPDTDPTTPRSRPAPATDDWATWARALVGMSRPSQLLLILVVYGAGVVMAAAMGPAEDLLDGVPVGRVLVGAVVLLLAAASVHYVNEYADYETDARATRTPFSGGSGALHRTGLPRGLALAAAVASGFLALLAMVVAGRLGAVSPVALGVLAAILVVGWLYSYPPAVALAWHGLGAPTNAALGGLALPAYGYAVVTGTVSAAVGLAFLPFTVLVFVNLLETTWPDRRPDASVGKRTIVTRFGPATLRRFYLLGVAVWAATLLLVAEALPPVVLLANCLPLPFLVWGVGRYTRRDHPFPAVAGMVVLAVGLLVGWAVTA